MNVIFLTLYRITDIESGWIYHDLMRKFRDEGHQVYIVSPSERRFKESTTLHESNGVKILNVKTFNIQKTSIVEKGVGTLMIERQYVKAIKRYIGEVRFDLITYSTPPITFTNVVKFLKKRNPEAISYLLLKDIFPQNAVDLGMVHDLWSKVHGLVDVARLLLYKVFRKKEVMLYKNSDYIGCMSPANVEFVRKHNPYYPADRVEIAPNSIELVNEENMDPEEFALKEKNERCYIRKKYDLPTEKPIFIYGGNLGKPQGIDYLIKCLDAVKNRKDCYFVVVGSGTEYDKIESWYNNQSSSSCVRLMQNLPKEDYDMLLNYCDVGLIFLDHRFTIPNYPSRLLSYLSNKMPVICATDVNTDIGKIAEENGYGMWCESEKPEDFVTLVDKMLASEMKAKGERGYEFLKENYLVEHTYHAIMKHFLTA